jgi:DNA mismatch endonuclease, patch repair protein
VAVKRKRDSASGSDSSTPEPRRRIMRAIKSRDTGPELFVRRVAHRLGFRFRVHRNDLPGKPDIVFPAKQKVIFVHGCFWHSHKCCGGRIPAQNTAYWKEKLARTVLRDQAALTTLTELGWKVTVLWECELQNLDSVERRLRQFLR